MYRKIASWICVVSLSLGLLMVPSFARAQQDGWGGEDAVFYAGSTLLSLLYFPVKLTTCVGAQAGSAVAYISTYRIPGNHEGGTNQKQIAKVAGGACTGPWVITFDEIKRDYP